MELRVSVDRASAELHDSVLFYTVTDLYILVPLSKMLPSCSCLGNCDISPQNLVRLHLQSETVTNSFTTVSNSFFNNMSNKIYYYFLLADVGSMTQKAL